MNSIAIITDAAPDTQTLRLIEYRIVTVDGQRYVITRTADDNGVIELIAWEPRASHDRETTIHGERLGALSMRAVPKGADFDDFWNECDEEARRVIAAAYPDVRGEYRDGSFIEEAP